MKNKADNVGESVYSYVDYMCRLVFSLIVNSYKVSTYVQTLQIYFKNHQKFSFIYTVLRFHNSKLSK